MFLLNTAVYGRATASDKAIITIALNSSELRYPSDVHCAFSQLPRIYDLTLFRIVSIFTLLSGGSSSHTTLNKAVSKRVDVGFGKNDMDVVLTAYPLLTFMYSSYFVF
jgi:hypothetical protein